MKTTNVLLSIALTVLWMTSVAKGTVLPVFIFAGQSNTLGMGITSQLPTALQQPQANVLFDNAYVNATPAWAPLQPPTEPGWRITPNGGQYAIDYVNGAFGPELTTGLGISNAMGGQQVAVVKYAVGATNLLHDWNPAAPTTGRQFYPAMVSRVNASVAALQAQNPTKTVQIAGFFWHQGESDQGLASNYQNDLTNFISHVRSDFGTPNLPFIIGQLGPHYIGDPIFQAQANVSTPGSPAYIPNTYTVTTTDLPMIFDGFHYNSMGQRQMGNRYAMAYGKLTGLPVQESTIISDSNLASEVLYSEDFDREGAKPGQSVLAAPIDWKLLGPNDAAKNMVGDVLLGADKYGWTGNYLEGSTAAAPEAENAFLKAFPTVNRGKVTLTCRAYAPSDTSAGSAVSLRPAVGRFSDRGGGWISTPTGWDFWVALVDSSPYPLQGQKFGSYQILKKSVKGGHDVSVELSLTVDLDHNKAWGDIRWKDDKGILRKFKAGPMPWDSAGGDVSNVTISIDKRSGHTGIAIDDLRVEGTRPTPHPRPFEQSKHTVLHLDGDKEPVSLPAEIQWISKPWHDENAQMPYLVYMPEKDRVLMLSECRKPTYSALIHSDDHGKTWSERRWLSVDKDGNPNAGALGLTYLGQGKVMAYSETLNPLWVSSDYGETWERREPKTPAVEMYAWDPLLVIKETDGRIARLAQGCWKPTGVPWATPGDPYSQGYFRFSDDEAQSWTDPVKVPQWLGVNEITMIVAPNGDWVAACRTDYPQRYAHHGLDHYGGLGVSISKDQGKTWSAITIVHEWGRHHPSMVLLPDGRILMTYVVRLGYPNAADGFPQFGVEAITSSDNGQTWNLDHRYVLAQWTGDLKGEDFWYSGVQSTSSVLLPDGTLLTAFGAGFCNAPGTTWCKMDVALVRWRMDGAEMRNR